jgi:hypothetical protein
LIEAGDSHEFFEQCVTVALAVAVAISEWTQELSEPVHIQQGLPGRVAQRVADDAEVVAILDQVGDRAFPSRGG